MEQLFGVRKGAWTEEEDNLLRQCIEKYGEGKWSKVPLRAGLRRCRKSCRLRWLNYLKPSIKRGEFMHDEVDLLLRLHRLLGNRWSLIAGRLPGRTANDIKNFLNTRFIRKKTDITTLKLEEVKPRSPASKKHEIIRPRPWTFPKSSPWLLGRLSTSTTPDLLAINGDSREMTGMTILSSGLQGSNKLEQASNSFDKELEKGKLGYISECVEDLQSVIQVGNNASLEEDSIGCNDDFLCQWTFPKSSPWLLGRLPTSTTPDLPVSNGDSREVTGMTIFSSILQGSTRLQQESNSFDKELEIGKSGYTSEHAKDLQLVVQVGNDVSLEEDSVGCNEDFLLDFDFWNRLEIDEFLLMML